ncbi:uncharacterized protein [Linepithema humile]|uniref:uncharacterized protein n=1 Tax=Linepithema humile TaxID=83485 RepID=UPI0006232231|nr:PREDICTED: uncharacterized protein LOC105679953 [Linepithema humile]
MNSRDEKACMELVFVRENSLSKQEKAKAFWKFLDAQNDLLPHKGTLKYDSPPKPESPVSSPEEMMKEKNMWRKGLKVFQHLGLDKTALAADNRCKLCLVHKTIQCEDLADTVTQPYDELNADMKAFEQRQKSRDSNRCKTLYIGGVLTQRGSGYAKTNKK